MKVRVILVAALAAAAVAQAPAHALRPACNPQFPAACLIVDTVCMHGRLCQ